MGGNAYEEGTSKIAEQEAAEAAEATQPVAPAQQEDK